MKEEDNIFYGRNAVIEALNSNKEIDVIYIQKGVTSDFEREIKALANPKSIAVKKIPKEAMDRMVKNNHQGVIAEGVIIPYATFELEVKRVVGSQKKGLFVILDGVTDVRNFGAIARSAEVLGVDCLVIPDRNSVRITSDAVKTSSGALSRIPVCKVNSIEEALIFLGENGVFVYASDLESDQALGDCNFNENVAIVIGSEGKGISRKVLTYADEKFKIPQVGYTNSLNVSVATGIILYEIFRQRNS